MLSRYRIGEKLGAGGMGVVLRAEDISLKRPVALKFLSGTALSQEQTRARFLREAQTAAALNHPNICTIYEVGEVQKGEEQSPGADEHLEPGTPFIAMELIEGRTLETIVRQSGSMPFDELLGIALQISDGMAAAHTHGIVHRDLKLGNVMVTKEGRVKILDFGLAKPLEPVEPGDAAGTAAATASAELTREGRVIGTAAYMSPEQAKGEPVDSRSDIFSFGVMLYELATGARPFRGTTTLSTLAKIIEAEPEPIPDTRADIPQELRRIVRRCLQKKPEDRYNDTRDLVAALKALRQETTSGAPRMASGAPPGRPGTLQRRRVALRIAAAAMAVIAVAAVAIVFWPKGVRRAASLPPTHRQLTFSADAFSPDLSRDGKSVLYIRRTYGQAPKLVVQDVTGGQPLEIFTGDVERARWSPSGTEILLIARNTDGESSASIIPRLGGPPRRLSVPVTSNVRWYGTWSPDGRRVAIASEDAKIAVVEIATGRSAPLAAHPDMLFVLDIDWASERGRLAVVAGVGAQLQIWTLAEDGSSHEVVFGGDAGPLGLMVRWTGRGDGIYFLRTSGQTTDVWKVPVDPATGRAAGEARPVLAGFSVGDRLGISQDGRSLAYARLAGREHIWLLERDADPQAGQVRVRALTSGTMEHRDPSLSPDGQTVAFVAGTGGKTNVFTVGLSGGNARQLTFLDGASFGPAWSPDGKRIAFVADHQGTARIWVVDAVEGSPMAQAKTTPERGGPVYWAPGSRILYRMSSVRNYSAFDPTTEDEEPIIPDLPEGWMVGALLAPDGSSVVFRWNRKPHRQVWLTERQQSARRLLLDSGSAAPIGWSADSKWIYVVDDGGGTNRVLRVSPEGGATEPLFEVPFEVGEVASASLDGKKFVFTRIDRSRDVWLAENFEEGVPGR